MIHKLRAKSRELKALIYELRYKLHATSVVDPNDFFGSGSFFGLNFGSGFKSGSGSGLIMKNTLELQII
jgi:hypothetical protein